MNLHYKNESQWGNKQNLFKKQTTKKVYLLQNVFEKYGIYQPQ